MPYISTDEVKKVREALKTVLPKNVKLSIVRRDGMCLDIAIMKASVPEVKHVNVYHYRDNGPDESVALIALILDTITVTHPRKTMYEDGDYGSIPNYYLNLSFGRFGKPYQQVK